MDVVAAVSSVAALAAVASGLNARVLRLSATIGVTAIALAASLVLVALHAAGLDAGLLPRLQALVAAADLPALLMRALLPLLLFAGALHVDVDALRAHGRAVALLAFVGTAVSTLAVAAVLQFVLGALGLPLPWIACLLFGALVSPTDPVAVLAMLASAEAPRELEAVIAGESLFNDGVGIVLFTLVLALADGATPTAGGAAWLLLRSAGGGLVAGALLGLVAARLLRGIADAMAQVALTLVVVVAGYTLANALGLSGALAMVVAGLAVGQGRRAGRTAVDAGSGTDAATGSTADAPVALERFWMRVDGVANAVLFTLIGLEVVALRLPATPMRSGAAALSTIAVVLVVRWLTAGLPVHALPRVFRLGRGAATVLTWGGLRGGIALALALSLPAWPWRETVVMLTWAVVAFAILVQGLTFARVVRVSPVV